MRRYQRIALAVAIATTSTGCSLWPLAGPRDAHALLRDQPETWVLSGLCWLLIAGMTLRFCKVWNEMPGDDS